MLRSLCPKGRHIFCAKRYPLSAILHARFSPGPVVHKLCDRRGGEWQFFSIAGFAHRARKIKFGRMPPFRFGDGKKYLPFSVPTYLLLSMKHTKASILTPSPPRYTHTQWTATPPPNRRTIYVLTDFIRSDSAHRFISIPFHSVCAKCPTFCVVSCQNTFPNKKKTLLARNTHNLSCILYGSIV